MAEGDKLILMTACDSESGVVTLKTATKETGLIDMDFVAVPKLLDALEKHAVRLGKTGYTARENWQLMLAELLDAPTFRDRGEI
jgi:hypothetical protein